jgi:hypothetical protein
MKRKISASLVKWKNSINRMPLVVNGARQVGKTYILEQFGKEQFENVVYLNMEIESALNKYFETELSPQRLFNLPRRQKVRK